MKIALRLNTCLIVFSAFLLCAAFTHHTAGATDWLTVPATYSHDPVSGQRVGQYQPIEAPAVPQPTNFRTSGYTHTRSTLNYGQSADNYHRVEKWGDPVRPYGQWRFPFRPYSTPYPNWGAPYAGLNIQTGFNPGFGFPQQGIPRGIQNGQPAGGYRPGLPRGGYIGRPRVPGDPTSGAAPIFNSPNNPYPAGGASPYPVAPYYDGYHPVYRD